MDMQALQADVQDNLQERPDLHYLLTEHKYQILVQKPPAHSKAHARLRLQYGPPENPTYFGVMLDVSEFDKENSKRPLNGQTLYDPDLCGLGEAILGSVESLWHSAARTLTHQILRHVYQRPYPELLPTGRLHGMIEHAIDGMVHSWIRPRFAQLVFEEGMEPIKDLLTQVEQGSAQYIQPMWTQDTFIFESRVNEARDISGLRLKQAGTPEFPTSIYEKV